MKLIVCLDDRNGMLFNRRRQSKDSALRTRVLKQTAGSRLWMNSYSAAQFEVAEGIDTDEEFMNKAEANDFCFVENTDISAYAGQVNGVIIYRWNRDYPADTTFPMALFEDKWHLVSREEFPGTSHDVITEEVYTL